jgi:hypothetical protein
MNQLQIVESIVDICSEHQLESVLGPIADLPASWTKAEMVSHCLNTELEAYGLKTHVSPDRASIFIDDQGMSQIVDFVKGKSYQPVLTTEHTERVRTVVDYANKNKVDLLWAQGGLRKKYYLFKQYGFNGINLYNLLNINSMNAAAAAISPVGAAGLTIAGVVALSWSGSLFFSSLENYIPNSMPKTKMVIIGLKYGAAFPIRCVEWTSNQIFGFAENVTIGHQLPINITEAYKLSVGPKLENIAEIKKPLLGWLIKQLNE